MTAIVLTAIGFVLLEERLRTSDGCVLAIIAQRHIYLRVCWVLSPKHSLCLSQASISIH